MPAKKNIHLVTPGYRRWLTPDMSELEFELEGFAADELPHLRARVFARELDSDVETTQFFALGSEPDRFVMPAPRFHSRGQLTIFIEQTRNQEPVAEGRWQLVAKPAEQLADGVWFDGRGVMIAGGHARFPLIWEPLNLSSEAIRASLMAAKSAGFNAVMVAPNPWKDAEVSQFVDAARGQKLQVLVSVTHGRPTPDQSAARVRLLRSISGVLGYVVAEANANIQPIYETIRRTDPSRPVVLRVSSTREIEGFTRFQDVVALAEMPTSVPLVADLHREAARRGLPMLGCVNVRFAGDSSEGVRWILGMAQQVTLDACGLIVRHSAITPSKYPWLGELARYCVNWQRFGIPMRFAGVPAGVAMSGRRVEQEFIVRVVNLTQQTLTVKLPLPAGKLIGDSGPITEEIRPLSVMLPPEGVRTYYSPGGLDRKFPSEPPY